MRVTAVVSVHTNNTTGVLSRMPGFYLQNIFSFYKLLFTAATAAHLSMNPTVLMSCIFKKRALSQTVCTPICKYVQDVPNVQCTVGRFIEKAMLRIIRCIRFKLSVSRLTPRLQISPLVDPVCASLNVACELS